MKKIIAFALMAYLITFLWIGFGLYTVESGIYEMGKIKFEQPPMPDWYCEKYWKSHIENCEWYIEKIIEEED